MGCMHIYSLQCACTVLRLCADAMTSARADGQPQGFARRVAWWFNAATMFIVQRIFFGGQGNDGMKMLTMGPSAPAGGEGAPRGKRLTLVLDLDETLVHVSFNAPMFTWFGRITCVPRNAILGNRFVKLYVLFRPGLLEFLRKASAHFDLVVFTASEKAYAEPVIEVIDSEGLFKQRHFRPACKPTSNGLYLKDLAALGYDMKTSIIVDNCETGILLNPDNGILIPTWTGQPLDWELSKTLNRLLEIKDLDDVRAALSKKTS